VSIEIDLSGRVALVTGSSRGLGRADALALARAGADVVLADIQLESEEGADEYGLLAQAARAQGLVYTERTAQEIRALGRRALAVRCDVTDRAQVEDTANSELGPADILVANAGLLDHVARLEDQSPELWERDLRVNLTGVFNCAQAVWPAMVEPRLGPNRDHVVGGRGARRLRPGELRGDEGRRARADQDAGARRRTARHHGERGRGRGSSVPRPSASATRR
jgi:NAD(P)-dependent dehydrogenase (short-subunit alcohol dehydrogenase family)